MRAAFGFEYATDGSLVQRIRTQPVHSFGGERDQSPGAQKSRRFFYLGHSQSGLLHLVY